MNKEIDRHYMNHAIVGDTNAEYFCQKCDKAILIDSRRNYFVWREDLKCEIMNLTCEEETIKNLLE